MHQINDENEANIGDVYQQHYSPTLLSLCSTGSTKQIFPEGSKQIEGLKPQKKLEETLKTESNRISTVLGTFVECKPLNNPHVDCCAHCGKIEMLTQQVRNAKGEWGHVCQKCGSLFQDVVRKREDA